MSQPDPFVLGALKGSNNKYSSLCSYSQCAKEGRICPGPSKVSAGKDVVDNGTV